MSSESTCPTPETLDDLISNRLPAAQGKELRAHIDTCPRCQKTLLGEPEMPARFPFLAPPQQHDELGWLGPYRITGILGEGGMSTVFEAEEPLLERKLALKVLRPELNDSVMRERFLREARALASLPSEHVVHVYAVGEEKETPYMAMERLQGESLAKRLKRDRTLPVIDALKIAREAAEGLEALHQKGIVHRDIKPDNLWLEIGNDKRFRGVKLIDFGVARFRSAMGDSALTVTGQILGTPAYMAPEQASGQKDVDGRADLYALGCVLYRMVTGLLPFDATGPNTMSLLQAVIKGDAPNVAKAAPLLSPPVAELIQQLMSRDPEDRPANSATLVNRLKELEKTERTSPTGTKILQAGASNPSRRTPRSVSPLALTLGGLAIVAAIIVGLVTVYSRFWRDSHITPEKPVFKVGVLFSQTDRMAVHELPIIDAIEMAIDEVNEKGGVLGHNLKAVIYDGASDPAVFEEQATKLIEEEKVEVIFGCWSSEMRRRVAAVCESNDRLLFYPSSDEGMEDSPNVIYMGGTPNQTIIPLIKHAATHLEPNRTKYFLVGGSDPFSRTVAVLAEREINSVRAKVVKTQVPVTGNYADVAKQIKESNADFIICMLDGAEMVSFFQALRKAGVKPPEVSTAWLALSEAELSHFNAGLVGDYTTGPYFESIDTPENNLFMQRFRKRFGQTRRLNDAMKSAYSSVYMWKQAVEKADSTDTSAVRKALRGMTLQSTPDGPIKIDAENLHAWRTQRAGEVVRKDGRLTFEILFHSPKPIPPVPFPPGKKKDEWKAFLRELSGK